MSHLKRLIALSSAPLKLVKYRAKKPEGGFGGFRKRTISTVQFVSSLSALAPQWSNVYRIWMKRDMDPALREELMLTVSELNQCKYCTWAHHEWANLEGVSDAELASLENLNAQEFDRRKWLAISYVRALVSANFGPVDAKLQKEVDATYSPQDIQNIQVVTKVMDLGNRTGNTWDALVSRMQGGPVGDTHLVDELLMGGAFLVVAPVVVYYLASTSGQPFLKLLRTSINLTKHAGTKHH